jgi:hypothetical protein
MYQGSMIGAGAVVFAVMGYVIANQTPGAGGELAPERLYVELNPKLLAFILGEGEEAVAVAIEFLCRPDPGSRTKEEEGRRLVRVGQFAYWVVNGRRYRGMRDPERRKEQNREAKRRERKKGKTAKQVRAEAQSREARFVEADGAGDLGTADGIAAEGLGNGAGS